MMASAARALHELPKAKHAPGLTDGFLSHHGSAGGTGGKRGGKPAAARARGRDGRATPRSHDEIRRRGAAWASGEVAELLNGWLQPDEGGIWQRGAPEALLARISATASGSGVGGLGGSSGRGGR